VESGPISLGRLDADHVENAPHLVAGRRRANVDEHNGHVEAARKDLRHTLESRSIVERQRDGVWQRVWRRRGNRKLRVESILLWTLSTSALSRL
jgi:hypothetical protein